MTLDEELGALPTKWRERARRWTEEAHEKPLPRGEIIMLTAMASSLSAAARDLAETLDYYRRNGDGPRS